MRETTEGSGAAGERSRRRWLRVVPAVGLGAIVAASVWYARPAGRAAGTRLGPDAALVRAGVRVAAIERRTPGRGRGRLPVYLAPARGPVIDSARVGALVARLVSEGDGGTPPAPVVLELVPPDAVQGLPLVGRLVVAPGESGLPVRGRRSTGVTGSAAPVVR